MVMKKLFNHFISMVGTLLGMFLIAIIVLAVIPAVGIILTIIVIAFIAGTIYTVVYLFLTEDKTDA